jgi:chromosome segregation ATPase
LPSDLVPSLKTAVAFANRTIDEGAQAAQRLSAALSLPLSDFDLILLEVRKLKREADLGRQGVSQLRQDRDRFSYELESISPDRVTPSLLSQYRSRLADLTRDIDRLREENTALSSAAEVSERAASRATRELADVRIELAKETRKCVELTKRNSQLQSDYAQLASGQTGSSEKVAVLSERLRAAEAEARLTSGTIQSLTASLESANQRITELSRQLDDSELEIARLRAADQKARSLLKENETYIGELASQNSEIANLRQLKAENEDLRRSLADVQSAYNRTRQRVESLNEKADEATVLREKVGQMESRITRLNAEVSENARLRAAATESEATISALTSRCERLQRDVTSFATSAVPGSPGRLELQTQIADLINDNSRLRKTVDRLTGQNATLQTACDVWRESARASDETRRLSPSRIDQTDRLETENRRLRREVSELQSQLTASHSAFDRTAAQLRDARNEVLDLRGGSATIDSLIARNAELNNRLEHAQAELRELRRISPRDDSGVSLKLSELEEDGRELRNAQTEVRVLSQINERLTAQLAAAENDCATLRDRLSARDAELARLRALLDSRQTSAATEELTPFIVRLEAALERFGVGELPLRHSLVGRLEAILQLIREIAEVFEVQGRSLDRIAGTLRRSTS